MTEQLVKPAAQLEVNESPLADIRLELVDSIDKAFEFKNWLGERRRTLGVDTETGGFKPDKDRLRMVQFGDLKTGWAIPWELWGGVVLEALNSYEGQLVMHNSPFDSRFLKVQTGWEPPWHRIDDTMTKAHLVDPTRPKGLKPLAGRLVDQRALAGQVMLDKVMGLNRWTWDTVPLDHPYYWMYAALDPLLTCHIDEHLDPIIKQRGYERAYDLEMSTMRIAARMMLKGFKVDLEFCDSKSKELRAWARTARKWIKDEYGVENATSNKQVAERLIKDGVPLTKRTPTGNIKLDKEILESIEHPLAQYVVAIRRAEKMCSAYLENFSNMVSADGRIRASINTMAAHTSRMSINDPALQTLLRDDPTVRDAFVPSEGNVLVTCDADQIEARLATIFSGDPGMTNAFLADGDFFCNLASQMLNETVVKGDKRRQIIKNTVYGKIYGAGASTIARTAKITYEVADFFVGMFNQHYPGINNLMHNITTVADQRLREEGRAYVRTPFGREIPTHPDERGDRTYALVNYLIQGHAAEILKQGLSDLDAVGLGDYLVLPVHDEVILDVPKEDAQEIRHLVETTLGSVTQYNIPLTWGAKILENRWGDSYH